MVGVWGDRYILYPGVTHAVDPNSSGMVKTICITVLLRSGEGKYTTGVKPLV